MRITYPNKPNFIGDDNVKNAFRLIKHNPAAVGMHEFVGHGYLGLCTGQTFGGNFSPQNFEPIAVARSQQATHLWKHEPRECLLKCKQYVGVMVMNTNATDTTPFAQANAGSINT